ncbi:MAG: ABC-F family ATP-binding cassette domain-containing protein, partial [Planctomycetota bacterium]
SRHELGWAYCVLAFPSGAWEDFYAVGMPVLAATNIELSYGERRVLDSVSLSVEAAEKIGVVGRNGGGKSSLMKILAGLQKADQGSVVLTGGARAGYLSQEPVLSAGRTMREEAGDALAHVQELETELHDVFERMAGTEGDELDRLLKEQERIEHRIDAAGGLAQDHKVDAILHGLGFVDAQFDVPTEGLSGGQKARLSLAKLLLAEPEVLLLDEPTNHLDIEGRVWLETFLKDEFGGAVVLISHDRRLLDTVVTRIVEVDVVRGQGGRLIDYPGNYAAFRRQRGDRMETQARAWEKQQTAFKREAQFIAKYKAGQRAKQAKGRESRLERAKSQTTLERPLESAKMRLALPKAERAGEIVASVRGLKKEYRDETGSGRTLFDGVDLVIERGDRIGIVGPNGAGKTTFVRCLLGEIEASGGTVNLGTKLSIGYFTQTHDDLDPELSVVRYLQKIVRKQCPDQLLSEQAARDLAGAFLFTGQSQERELGLLSGGERARAVLAGLMASAKNVLVLDEPTNHLDIPSAERLEEVLRRPPSADEMALDETLAERGGGLFDGTLILISHDRALLEATCSKLIVLDGAGNAEVFLGRWSDWERKLGERRAARVARQSAAKTRKPAGNKGGLNGAGSTKAGAKSAANEKTKPVAVASGPKPVAKAEKSKWSWMRVEQLEAKIGVVEKELSGIDTKLADPDVWTDYERADSLTSRRDELKVELEGLEAEWVRKAE